MDLDHDLSGLHQLLSTYVIHSKGLDVFLLLFFFFLLIFLLVNDIPIYSLSHHTTHNKYIKGTVSYFSLA